jgi:hypothetical protein
LREKQRNLPYTGQAGENLVRGMIGINLARRGIAVGNGYEDYVRGDDWKRVASEFKRLRGNKCERCDKVGNLDVHHMCYKDDRGQSILYREQTCPDLIKVLCRGCHDLEHPDKVAAKQQAKLVTPATQPPWVTPEEEWVTPEEEWVTPEEERREFLEELGLLDEEDDMLEEEDEEMMDALGLGPEDDYGDLAAEGLGGRPDGDYDDDPADLEDDDWDDVHDEAREDDLDDDLDDLDDEDY